MRPKKDPSIRREQFIDAAAGLFLQYKYEDVSIKTILNAVGERTASPSVFYYYFADKDELYRAAVESIAASYVGGLEEVFTEESLSLDEQLKALIAAMHRSLTANMNLAFTGLSCQNRSFILDMKEQVTASFAGIWEHFLAHAGLADAQDAHSAAVFIAGGISSLIMEYMMQDVRSEHAELELLKEIVLFSASVIGLDDAKKQQLLQCITNN